MTVGQEFFEKFLFYLQQRYECINESDSCENLKMKSRILNELSVHKTDYLKLIFSENSIDIIVGFVAKLAAFIIFRQKSQKLKNCGFCGFLNRKLTDLDKVQLSDPEFSNKWQPDSGRLLEGFFHFVSQCSLNPACREINSFVLAIYSGHQIYKTSAVPRSSNDEILESLDDNLFFQKFDEFVEARLGFLYSDFQSTHTRNVPQTLKQKQCLEYPGDLAIETNCVKHYTSLAVPISLSNGIGFAYQKELDYVTVVLQVLCRIPSLAFFALVTQRDVVLNQDDTLSLMGMQFALYLLLGNRPHDMNDKTRIKGVQLPYQEFFPFVTCDGNQDPNEFLNSLLPSLKCGLFDWNNSLLESVSSSLSVTSFQILIKDGVSNSLQINLGEAWGSHNVEMHSIPACLVVRVSRGSKPEKVRGIILNKLNKDTLTYPSSFDLQSCCPLQNETKKQIFHLHAVIVRTGKYVESGKYLSLVRNYGYNEREYPSNINSSFHSYDNESVCGVSESYALGCTGEDELKFATTFLYISDAHLKTKNANIEPIHWEQVRRDMNSYFD